MKRTVKTPTKRQVKVVYAKENSGNRDISRSATPKQNSEKRNQ